MAKTTTIELTEQDRRIYEQIITICAKLEEMKDKTLSTDDIALCATLIRALLGDNQESSLLYRAGFTNLRFMDTARPLGGVKDFTFGDNLSNYNLTGLAQLPLLAKRIEQNQSIFVEPLYLHANIKQSAYIEYSQWYLHNHVYEGAGMAMNRQSVLLLVVLASNLEKNSLEIVRAICANSGIIHNGGQVPFANNPLDAMAEEILYEVTESLRVAGILEIRDAIELARLAHRDDELFLQSLYIKNYRLYKGEQEFAFQNRFTVLIGDNATGKTTILDAIRIILDTIIPPHRMDSKKWISTGIPSKFSLSSVHRELSEDGGLDYSWPVEITANSCYGKIARRRKSRANRSTKKNNKNLLDELNRLPLIVYCGVERTRPLEKRKIEEKFSGDRYDAYFECLNTRTTSTYLKLWLRDLQQKAKTSKKAEVLLTSFIDAVCSCLKEENITNIQYIYQEAKASDGKVDRIDDIVLTQRSPGTESEKRMLFGTLSAGYRVMIGMIANLAYRCIVLNPQLGKDAITGTSGIVLIDEIDMHLHPLWQRHVVADLMRCFPKVQFIATTHSPFVVQSLNEKQVKNLNGQPILHNPIDGNLAVNALYMGVDSDRSLRFEKEMDDAYDFLKAVDAVGVTEQQIDLLMDNYAIRHSDNPIYVAKLRIEANMAKNALLYKEIDAKRYEASR